MESAQMESTRKSALSRPLTVGLLALVCCALWGSAFPCIKLGYAYFAIGSGDTAAQVLFAGLRFTLAGALTILIGSVLHRRALVPARASLPKIVKLSLMQTVIQYLFFYVGLAHTSGVKSSIIESSTVFLTILAASLLFKQERMTLRKLLGCAVGFAGVVLINVAGQGVDMRVSLLGEGAILISACAYALSSVMIKIYSRDELPITLSGYQFLLGGAVLIVCGLIAGGRIAQVSIQGLLMLAYLALLSAVAYSLWGTLLKYNPVARVSIYGFMNPVCGVLLSALLLGESQNAFGAAGLAALALVCAGIWLVNGQQAGKRA